MIFTENVKKLGFGLMRLPEKDGKIDIELSKKMVDEFIGAGFTYFDTAYVYGGGASECAAKEILTSRYDRSEYKLATKLALWLVKEPEDMQKQFETQLERTGVEYFDYYLIHCLDKDRFEFAEKIGAWDFVKGLKEKGLVKHIGFSFHDTADVLDKGLAAHPEAEFVQLQINYKDWDDERVQSEKCYNVARAHGKEIIIMEPVKGGMLAGLAPEAEAIFKECSPKASVASFAIRYAASLEGVLTVLSGMSNYEQTKDNAGYMKDFEPLSEKEKDAVERVRECLKALPTVQCTGCSYCTDGCPSKIKIPKLFSAYNNWLVYRSEENSKREYDRITGDSGKASDCIGCEQCEGICPQHLPIVDLLKTVSTVFDK